MIAYKEMKQKSIEWLEMKWGKIGGTAAKGLFVKSPTLLIDLLSQHLEEFEPLEIYENEHMQRGNDLEPFAVEYVEKYTGFKFESFGWLQSEESELLGLSPDGLTSDLKQACEVKCFSRKKHMEVLLSEQIPLEHVQQCVHYFTVNPDLETLYFCAFRPEAVKNFVKEINRETELNIGTYARPVLQKVSEIKALSLIQAGDLLEKIKELSKSIKF
jgi:hypothetical protein